MSTTTIVKPLLLHHTRIIIIDDDLSMRKMCERILKRNAYEVMTAHDGKLGLDVLKKNPTDLIILDYNMPGDSGLKVLGKTRKLFKKIFVIILTGSDISGDIIDDDNDSTRFLSKGEGEHDLLGHIKHGMIK